MKYYLVSILVLLSLYQMHANTHFNDIFARNTIITHAQTGLFLSYVGLYTPAETNIHNSAIFPMTTARCYFLPLAAAANIPSCNITSKRYKRFLAEIVSLGIGTKSLRISKSNKKQLKNLEKQIKDVGQSLSKYSETMQVQEARLAKVKSNQIILTEELQLTQQTINAILPILKSHYETLNPLKVGLEHLHNRFKHSSLYLAINQIFRNDLTLNFFSPEHLHKVVYDIIHQGNITFNSNHGSIPVIEIITALLVRQQIDFIPQARYTTQNPDEIGRLVITNFFGIPQQNRTPFQIYKLLTVPFSHKNETIQLTHIPRYWAINPADNTTMEWYDPEDSKCNFELMTSCHDTPPLQKLSDDTCLGQIIIGSLPSTCQTMVTPVSPVFLRQLRDNFWVSSSSEPLDCLNLTKDEYLNTVDKNFTISKHLSVPSVALINVTPGHVITCPRFTLIGRPIISSISSLIIFNNDSVFTNNASIFDVYRYLRENTAWFDRKPFKLGADGVIYRLDSSIEDDNFPRYVRYIWFFTTLVLCCIFSIVISFLMQYIRKYHQ